jgi:hypothetical protein
MCLLCLAIREILFRYEGRYEEFLPDWYLALKLVVPELVRPRQVIDVFKGLSEAGVIDLHKPGIGPYTGGDDFFIGGAFTATLTRVVRSHIDV